MEEVWNVESSAYCNTIIAFFFLVLDNQFIETVWNVE